MSFYIRSDTLVLTWFGSMCQTRNPSELQLDHRQKGVFPGGTKYIQKVPLYIIYIRIHSIYIYIINIVCIYIHSIYYDYIYIYKYPPLYPHLAVNSFHCGPAWNCWFPEAELQGDGLARQRGAIIDGLRTAVLERSVAGNMSCPYFVTTRLPSGNQAWRWNPPNSFRWFSC